MSTDDVRWFLTEVGPPMTVVIILAYLLIKQFGLISSIMREDDDDQGRD